VAFDERKEKENFRRIDPAFYVIVAVVAWDV
jgi:hypothetical protein